MVGIVLPNLAGLFGRVAGRGFQKTLTESDFGITSDVDVKANKWNKIGEFKVPPQQAYRWGYGNPNQPYNQGYMYVYIKDSGGSEIKGKIRLAVSDYNELSITPVYEERSEVLHAATSDITKQKALPEQGPMAREDDKLLILFMPDSDATISASNTEIKLPVTLYPR